jgi:hypothetical protein
VVTACAVPANGISASASADRATISFLSIGSFLFPPNSQLLLICYIILKPDKSQWFLLLGAKNMLKSSRANNR